MLAMRFEVSTSWKHLREIRALSVVAIDAAKLLLCLPRARVRSLRQERTRGEIVVVSSLNERASGILLHPTSLPGPHGVGDLGADARRFVDFLHAAGQTFWQMLPVGPLGYGNSPYSGQSAFAGNPLLIALPPLTAAALRPAQSLLKLHRFSRRILALSKRANRLGRLRWS